MMIQNNNAGQYNVSFSPVMQHRVEMMLRNANMLFSIGWLRKRLWTELGRRISEIPATEYENYGRWLRNHFEIRFILEFLSAYQKSLASIRQIIGNAYDTQNPLEELMEDREELIREFACMPLSKTWNCVKDDDESWHQFAHRFPFGDPGKKEEIDRFFEILDRISIITDILCRRAKEYGLEIDYSSMPDSKMLYEHEGSFDEVLAKAIENVSFYMTKKSAWAVVFCVLRDYYNYQNQADFERHVKILPLKGKMPDCSEGTISSTFRDNKYMILRIDKWPIDKKFTKFALELRAAIQAELNK
jgi:hypothetical protein